MFTTHPLATVALMVAFSCASNIYASETVLVKKTGAKAHHGVVKTCEVKANHAELKGLDLGNLIAMAENAGKMELTAVHVIAQVPSVEIYALTVDAGRDSCRLPAETGPCKAAFQSWYFDSASRRCQSFVWGGCQGNANRFASKEGCEKSCSVVKRVDLFRDYSAIYERTSAEAQHLIKLTQDLCQ